MPAKHLLRRSLIALGIGCGVLAGLAIAVVIVLRSDRFDESARRVLETQLSRILNAEARVGTLALEPLRGEFHAVGITARTDRGEFLTIESVSGSVDPLALAGGRVVVRDLQAGGVRIALKRAGGTWSWTPPRASAAEKTHVRIDRFVLSGGALRIEDEDRGVVVAIEDISMTAGGVLGESVEGRADSHTGTLTVPRAGTTELASSVEFVLRPDKLEVTALRAESGWGKAEGSGHWDLQGAGTGRFHAAADLKLDALAAAAEVASRPAGRVHVDGRLEHTSEDWIAAGSATGEAISWKRWSVSSFTGPFHWSGQGGLDAGPIEAKTSGGIVRLRAASPPGAATASLDIEAESLRLSALEQGIGRPLPFEAQVSGRGRLEWRRAAGDPLRGRAEFTLSPLSAAGLEPLGGSGRLTLSGETVTFSTLVLSTPAAQVTGEGTWNRAADAWDLTFEGRTDNLAAAAPVVARSAEVFGLHTGEWRLETLSGSGVIDGMAKSRGRAWTAAGTLSATGSGYRGVRWGSVSGRYRLDDAAFSFEGMTAHRDGQSATLDARFYRGPGGFDLSATASPWLLEEIRIAADLDVDLTGLADGKAHVARRGGEVRAEVEGTARSGRYLGVPYQTADVALRFETGRLLFDRLEAVAGGGHFSGTGAIAVRQGSGRFDLKALDVDLAPLELSQGLAGRLEASGHIDSKPGALRLEAEIRVADTVVKGASLGLVTGALTSDFQRVDADLQAPGIAGTMKGWVELAPPRRMQGRIHLEGSGLDRLARVGGTETGDSISGSIGANLRFEGEMDKPEGISVTGSVSRLDLFVGTASAHLEHEVSIRYEGGRAVFSDALLTGEWTHLAVSGSVTSGSPPILDLAAAGGVDLGVLGLFVPGIIARGKAEIDLRIQGPSGEPDVRGEAVIHQGRIRRVGLATALENLEAQFRIQGRTVELQEISADVGGGTLRGNGRVVFQSGGGAGFEGDFRGNAITLVLPFGLRATWSGTLHPGGTLEHPLLSGDIQLLRASYTRDFGLESFSLFGRERNLALDPGIEGDWLESVGLDLHVHGSEGLWLDNDMGQLESRADLRLGGNLRRPALAGRITAFEGGRLTFRRVDYVLRDATVDFDGPRIDNPYINASAETRVAGYDITLSMRGELAHLEVALSSSPSLPQNQIVSLLVTGSTDSLEGELGSTSGDVGRSYLGGALTGFLEDPVEKMLNVDTFRVVPLTDARGNDPTTRVSVGKRVTRDLYLSYSREMTGDADSIYSAEYQFTRRLRGYAETESDGGLAGDVRYSTRFRYRRAPPATEAQGQGAPRPPIASIELKGVEGNLADAVRRKLALKAGQPFSRRALIEGRISIRQTMLQKGFLEATVESAAKEGPGGMAVAYTIEKGRKIQVEIIGAKRSDRRILRYRMAELWEQAHFTEDLLDQAVEEVVSYYQEQGFYTAYADRSLTTQPNGGLMITLRIDPGPRVRISRVDIEGEAAVPEEDLRPLMLTRPDTKFSDNLLKPSVLADDAAAMRRHYLGRGYSQARIEPVVALAPDGASGAVTFKVAEGPLAIVSATRIEVNGETWEPPRDGSLTLETVPGEPYSPAEILGDESLLRDRWDAQGYPDAKAITEARRTPDGIEVVWRVTTGERQTLKKIEIVGNDITQEKVIRRELGLTTDEPLRRADLDAARQRLYRLGVFDQIVLEPVPTPKGREGERILRVRVSDADNLTAAVGLGYDTEVGPRGTFELSDANFRGRGRALSFQTRLASDERRIQLTGRDPRLFGRKWTLLLPVSWEYEKKDSFNFDRYSISLQVQDELVRKTNAFIRYNYNVADVRDLSGPVLDADEGPLQPGKTRLGSIGYSVFYNGSDDPFNPKTGVTLLGDLRVFSPILGSDPHADEAPPPQDKNNDGTIDASDQLLYAPGFVKLFLQETWHVPLGHNVVFSQSARLGAALPYATKESVALTERYFSGGDSSVRGFERDHLGSPAEFDSAGNLVSGTIVDGDPIGGEGLLIFNQEVRFPIKGSVGGTVFYDAGNTFLESTDLSLSDLRHVLGTGLRVDTPIGPLRVEYGHKLDRKPGESAGQFFISIGPAF